MMFRCRVNLTFKQVRDDRRAWLNPPHSAVRYTAILRCRIGDPNVRLAAASMMLLVSRP